MQTNLLQHGDFRLLEGVWSSPLRRGATAAGGARPRGGLADSMGAARAGTGRKSVFTYPQPLYGTGPLAQPCFNPLMRLTAVVIDRAGNIWATNNWKPDFDIDIVNSGGDGICIFVGLAKPPALT